METFGNTNSLANASATTKKLDVLRAIGAGEIIDTTLNKLIDYQLAKYKDYVRKTKDELKKYEHMYKMTSDVFYHKFESGVLGDEGDFFEWSGLYENVLLYEERIRKIESLDT